MAALSCFILFAVIQGKIMYILKFNLSSLLSHGALLVQNLFLLNLMLLNAGVN